MAVDADAHRVIVVFRSPARLMVFGTRTGNRGQASRPAAMPTMFRRSAAPPRLCELRRGVIDVLAAEPGGYERIARIPTVAGARTSLFVPAIDRLYLACGRRRPSRRRSGSSSDAMNSHERHRADLPAAVAAWPWPGTTRAQAYRPFDGTDAAVAEPGEVEIELGPRNISSRIQTPALVPGRRLQLRALANDGSWCSQSGLCTG